MSAFSKLVRDQNGFPVQALSPDPAAVARVAIGASSARVALPANSDIVRVAASDDCVIKFGDNTVTAVEASDSVFPKGAEVVAVPAGATNLAVINLSGSSGVVSVTRMV